MVSEASASQITKNEPTNGLTEEEKDGEKAWIQAFGAFLIYVATWGLLSSYGSYRTYYETTMLIDKSTDEISWIGTVEAVLMILGGIMAGPIYDRGYFRELLFGGTLLIVFSVMTLSLTTKYYQIMLAQGLGIGIGGGMLYTPSISLVAGSFSNRWRGLAVCFATCGSALGGVVYPILMDRLIPSVGLPWATRILGFITLAELILGMAVILSQAPKKVAVSASWKTPRSLFGRTAMQEPVFGAMCLGMFFMWTAYWVPLFLIPTFGHFALDATPSLSTYLLVIANASSIPGRIFAGLIIPYIDTAGGFVAFGIFSTIVLFAWTAVKTKAVFIAWAVILGFSLNPLAVLQPTIIPELSPTKELVGTRMGIALGSAAFGVLMGVPVSSALIDTSKGQFWKMQVFIASCMMIGTGLMAFVWWRLRRQRQMLAKAMAK